MSSIKIMMVPLIYILALSCGGPYGPFPAPEEPMFDPETGKVKMALNGCYICEIPKNKTQGLSEGDKVNVHLPVAQTDRDKYSANRFGTEKLTKDLSDESADLLSSIGINASMTFMTKEETADAKKSDIAKKLQAKIVESLIDKGVNAVASDSKSGNYMTFDILSYTPGNKWLRFLDMPGLNVILTIMGAEYNSDLSLGWNLHMPALERDFNMFKNPENDPSGFFGLFKNADKRNMKYAGPKIAKSIMKKKK